MRGASIVVILCFLAGCTSSSTQNPDLLGAGPHATAIEPLKAFFVATTRSGGELQVAALAWIPAHDNGTAIILVHGYSGVKENYWNTLPAKGYSFGARLAAQGRSVFAIDLPGYGATPAPTGQVGMEDYAYVVKQVADHLKAGDYRLIGQTPAPARHVVAYGLSMGGLVVNLAQGLFSCCDAIVPTGWAHTAFSACTMQQAPCPPPPQDDFWLPNTDPDVVNATLAGYQGAPPLAPYSIATWAGPCEAAPAAASSQVCQVPQPGDAAAAAIRVPVLVMIGEHDSIWDNTTLAQEPSHYPQSPDASIMVWKDTAHFVHNHRNQTEVAAFLDSWLSRHAL